MEVLINSKKTINADNIIKILGESNYTTLYFDNGDKKMVLAKTLRIVHEKFANYSGFLRISKSTIINFYNIESFDGKSVILKNGEILKPSRRRQKDFYNQLNRLAIIN